MKKIQIPKMELKGRFQKFMVMTSLALIPAIVTMIMVASALIYVDETERINLHSDYVDEIENNQDALLNVTMNNFIDTFDGLESTSKAADNYITNLFDKNSSRSLPSAYINRSLDGSDLDLTFSEKHNRDVDFGRTSYYVLGQETFGNWSREVNETIRISSMVDIVFQGFYLSNPQILWINMIFDDGVIRTYPYSERNASDYNFQNQGWYLQSRGAGLGSNVSLFFSEPLVDLTTGRLVINVGHPVYFNSNLLGVLNFVIDFARLDNLNKDIMKNTKDTTSYIFTSERKVLSHPKLEVPKFGWNDTYLNISIEEVELVDLNYSLTIDRVILQGYIGKFLTVNGTTYVVDMTAIGYSDLYLAILREISPSPVYASFPLLDLLLIPVLTSLGSFAALVAIQKRYGFLKGKDLEELLQSFSTAMDSIDEIKSKVTGIASGGASAEDVSKTVAEAVSEKISETAEEMRTKVQEKADEVMAKVEEQVDKVSDLSVEGVIEAGVSRVEDKIDSALDRVESILKNVNGLISKVNSGEITNIEDFTSGLISSGIDIEAIKSGDFSPLSSIESPAIKLVTLASAVDEIKIDQLSEILSIDQRELTRLMNFFPAQGGVALDVDTVKFNKQLFISNLPSIVNTAKDILE